MSQVDDYCNPSPQSPVATCGLLFVKSPQPGKVKTRLGEAIGDHHATQLYRCFAEDVLATLHQFSGSPLIFYAPADQGPVVSAWLGPAHQYYPQQGRDLGERMAQAFQQAFQLGYRQVLVIGSDSPDLPLGYLQAAGEALAHNSVALGPSQDGGYYLLGFTPANFTPAAFENISWSTATVYNQTLERLHQHQRRVHQLPTWYDVDTLDDLRQFYQRNQTAVRPSLSLNYLTQHQREFFDPRPT